MPRQQTSGVARMRASGSSRSELMRLRAMGWIAVLAMLAAAAVGATTTSAAEASTVNSITVPDCVPGTGISGTVDVTVVGNSFTFDIWVTDHVPGESDFVEVPGSRQTLTFTTSGTHSFGPLDASQHRAAANTLRVESSGSTAKSRSIPPCSLNSAPPSSAPPSSAPPSSAPPSSAPPSSAPPSSAPPSSAPPSSAPPSSAPPSSAPPSSAPPSSAPPSVAPTGSSLSETATPQPTLPRTDALPGQAQPSSDSWRFVLVTIAALLAGILVLTPIRRRR
jgi:hypothetical protein